MSAPHVLICAQLTVMREALAAKRTNQSPATGGHLFYFIIRTLLRCVLTMTIHSSTPAPADIPLTEKPTADTQAYRTQHKLRLSYMPWLYERLKPAHRVWAQIWQEEVQAYLRAMETIMIGNNCFIAPEARLFAEPGRPIVIGDNCWIAADTVIHGPVTFGNGVSINHHVTLDGGSKGIVIGNNSRLAAYSCAYAFNHGMEPDRLIKNQPVTSRGIYIGDDVWVGAHAGILDGVSIGTGAVIGMGSIVTKTVPSYTKMAGNPARPIGSRLPSEDPDKNLPS